MKRQLLVRFVLSGYVGKSPIWVETRFGKVQMLVGERGRDVFIPRHGRDRFPPHLTNYRQYVGLENLA